LTTHNIAGKWRGNYQYAHVPDQGSSFTAVFAETSGRIQGTVVDDFAPCEAHVAGSFSFPSLQFTKVYSTGEVVRSIEKLGDQVIVRLEDYAHPVEYEGVMSEDGQTMSGTWSISIARGIVNGFWTAHRLSGEEKKKRTEKVKDLEWEERLL